MVRARIFIVFLGALLLVGCDGEAAPPVTPTTGAAGAATPTPAAGARETIIVADGQLQAPQPPLALGFAAGGRVLSVDVAAGDVVAAGELLATLDDAQLREAVVNAEQQVAQATIGLAQAQLALDMLLTWTPDDAAQAVAEANLAAARAALAGAEAQDAVAGSSLTASRVAVEQAQRALGDVQEAYDRAFDPGRAWELETPGYREALEAERDAVTNALRQAQESLQIARANYALAVAGLNDNRALDAQVALANAEQALLQATTGPLESDIAAAELQAAQAELTLEQAQTMAARSEAALGDARLLAPWPATVLTVEVAPGALLGSGTPVVTLLGTGALQFHTSNLSERDLAQIAPGLPVALTLKAYPAETLSGTVARIEPRASGSIGDAATFTVVVDLGPSELALLAGMTGRIEIRNAP